MTDNWDLYFCVVDDRPASILVDLGCAAFAPVPEYPFMGYVSVEIRMPDEDGFPGPGEFDALNALEDALEAALARDKGSVYVGRCATDGRLDFFYYLKSEADWAEAVADFMDASSAHAWDAGSAPDPEWRNYLEFLFPGEYDMLAIQNRRAYRRLQESGDDTVRARFIEHWLAFADAGMAAAFSASAAALGYQAEEAQAPPDEGDTQENGDDAGAPVPPLWVRLSRIDAPDAIDEVTFTLADLAKEFGGEYRGWSSPVTGREEG